MRAKVPNSDSHITSFLGNYQILGILHIEHRSVTLDELCTAFQISIATLRRDLDKLTPRGTVEKVYGGVIARNLNDAPLDGLISYSERNIQNADEKNELPD